MRLSARKYAILGLAMVPFLLCVSNTATARAATSGSVVDQSVYDPSNPPSVSTALSYNDESSGPFKLIPDGNSKVISGDGCTFPIRVSYNTANDAAASIQEDVWVSNGPGSTGQDYRGVGFLVNNEGVWGDGEAIATSGGCGGRSQVDFISFTDSSSHKVVGYWQRVAACSTPTIVDAGSWYDGKMMHVRVRMQNAAATASDAFQGGAALGTWPVGQTPDTTSEPTQLSIDKATDLSIADLPVAAAPTTQAVTVWYDPDLGQPAGTGPAFPQIPEVSCGPPAKTFTFAIGAAPGGAASSGTPVDGDVESQDCGAWWHLLCYLKQAFTPGAGSTSAWSSFQSTVSNRPPISFALAAVGMVHGFYDGLAGSDGSSHDAVISADAGTGMPSVDFTPFGDCEKGATGGDCNGTTLFGANVGAMAVFHTLLEAAVWIGFGLIILRRLRARVGGTPGEGADDA